MATSKRIVPDHHHMKVGEVYEIKRYQEYIRFEVLRISPHAGPYQRDFSMTYKILKRPELFETYKWYGKDSGNVNLEMLRGYEIYHLPYYNTPLYKVLNGEI